MKRFKKPFVIALSIVIASLLLIFIFLSPITKFLLEKYDKDLCGRELTLIQADKK